MKKALLVAIYLIGFIVLGLVVYVRLNTPEGHPNFPQEYVEGRPVENPPHVPELNWQNPTPR